MKVALLAVYTYLALISLVSIGACITDKLRSRRRGARRIAERTLIGLAALGGACAMYLTMLLIRHKTLHPKFMIGLPALMLLHASIFAAAVFYFDLGAGDIFILSA